MTLTIDIPEAQLASLREAAERLGVPTEELAQAMIADQLGQPKPDFDAALNRVLEKNEELYRRLG